MFQQRSITHLCSLSDSSLSSFLPLLLRQGLGAPGWAWPCYIAKTGREFLSLPLLPLKAVSSSTFHMTRFQILILLTVFEDL